ncbi:replication protein A 32 kDa subunit C-like isoform X2 [Oryza brachyantha]|uniref:replication protein A 32 kDa subunit C-like isoform X2 n=1 Tax=Oryza brachyantha TaxID=4533 RepID=UPI000776801E|nr:replication protein A 32 kDa subunit C-like isoform X2 [Oryza brachyantha]
MAAAASHFSGMVLMPSQRSGASGAEYSAAGTVAAAPSPSKTRDPRFSGCVPATVRHISRSFAAAAAADGGGDPVFSIDGVETTNVRVLGRVATMTSRETDVSFTLDDGTGKIALVRWITDPSDTRETSYIHDGAYVKVQVNLTGFQAKKQGFARSIRPITNFNEVVLHFIECMHVHLDSIQLKMQKQLPPAVQTNGYPHVPFSGGVRDYQVHFNPQVNQGLPPAVQTNTSTYVPLSGGVRDYQAHFPQVNQEQFHPAVQASTTAHVPFSGGVREHQIHFTPKVTQGQFPPSVQTNASAHVPYSGVIREHQAHFTPPINQGQFPPVPTSTYNHVPFSGGVKEQVHLTQANQHDVQRMVLEVMKQPDILAFEHGVHVDELARRTGMPKPKIVEATKHLADEGHVYWTIDDNHVKSMFNG